MTEHEKVGAKSAGTGGALKGGAVAVVLVVLGLVIWALSRPGEAPAPQPEAQTAEAPVAAPADAPATGTAPASEPSVASDAPEREQSAEAAPSDAEQVAENAAPESQAESSDLATVQFDALRAAPDGSVTLAGRTDPGAKVDILVDGQSVSQVQADGAGNFVALFDLPPVTDPRALSLKVTGADGQTRESAETLVLRGQPEAVAAAASSTDAKATEVAAQPAAPIVADAEGARVLAPASKALVIDTISFGAGETARSEGRGAPEGSDLAAYLDDTLVAEAKPGADGRWVLGLPGLGTGKHKLRIDARDGTGTVIARAETEFDQPDQIVVASAAGPAGAEAQAVSQAGGAGDAVKVVQIVEGNTLWAIAREVYGDGVLYVRVFDANRDQIRNPDLIYPGQVFTIPAPGSASGAAAQ
ncbi:LysM peptidoglycan-binding domain-containing protein [Thioclava pacifica]|uniref:LysM domain-containing protein n=1 Tax=Thioclava pacifica DSM 10166 TaxID=1353537 RepID=A0A074JK75_9RHOB|nr:LysM peptidoglycan-binding domain-containing protein [Thioclava pacifica]KEO56280.1 hypothetical protein TP2_01785 [Thioclava pacifica DSM 10166]